MTEALHASGFEVHFLCKRPFLEILKSRPDIKKVWLLEDSLDPLLDSLKNEKFDYIIDLHNNIRSKKVKTSLSTKTYTLSKPRIDLFLMTQFGIRKKQQEHIVNRFLTVAKPLLKKEGNTQLSFSFCEETPSIKLPDEFISIAVGAAFYTKQIPNQILIDTINGIDFPVVLIGGQADVDKSKAIEQSCEKDLTNLTGQLSITDSAFVIKKSKVLITGDTGMMHLATALQKSVIAVFGSTHPFLGYTPFYGETNVPFEIIQNSDLGCRPCTKQGKDQCPKGHFKCMKDIEATEIIEKSKQFI